MKMCPNHFNPDRKTATEKMLLSNIHIDDLERRDLESESSEMMEDFEVVLGPEQIELEQNDMKEDENTIIET